LLCSVFLLISWPTHASQTYPYKPITTIGPWGEGGGTDTVARAVASVMHDYIGQPFVHMNMKGASGTIAGQYITNAKQDGYTIGAFTSAPACPEIRRFFVKAKYTSEDLKPIIRVTYFPFVIFTDKNSPFSTLTDMVEDARKKPGKLAFCHYGRADPTFILMHALSSKTNIELRDVPFDSISQITTTVLGGHAHVGVSSLVSVMNLWQANQIKILGVYAPKRLDVIPDVPNFDEQGYGLELGVDYLAYFAPKGTSQAIVTKLHDSIKKAMDESKFLKRMMKRLNLPLYYGGPDDVRESIKRDKEVLPPILKRLGFWSE